MPRMSDRFYQEIVRSHTVVAYVDIISADQEVIRLPAIDGGVNVDGTASFRRKCSVKCIDPTGLLTPSSDGGALMPRGTEMRPYRGVRYADGQEEVAPLGVFRLSEATIDDSAEGSPEISLEAFDRSRTISRDKFTVPYTIPAQTNVLDAIKDIVKRTYPAVVYDTISTAVTTTAPMLFEAGDDPWEACGELAKAMGCVIYFDADGDLAILPPDDVNALPQPEFSYVEGESCTMLGMSRRYSDDPGYNGVIVTGESVGDELPPVRGEAWDDNPTSPTYRHGPYGEVPAFHTDKVAKTADEAKVVAQLVLADMLGAAHQIEVTAIVHPALEAGDIVRVRRERSGVDGLYAVDAFPVPLKANATQSLTLRERRPA